MVKKGSGKGSTAKKRAAKSRQMQQERKGRQQATGKDTYKDPGKGEDGQQKGR